MYKYMVYEGIGVLPIRTKINLLTNKKIVFRSNSPAELYDFWKKYDKKYEKHDKLGNKNCRRYRSNKQFKTKVHRSYLDNKIFKFKVFKIIKEFVAVKYNTKTAKYSYWHS